MKPPASPLDNLKIASPCNASWEAMAGSDKVRFCEQCHKNVYNLSSMRREEAEALLAGDGRKPCVRFYQRADGTVLTEDCPVGLLLVKRAARHVRAVWLSGTTMLFGLLGWGVASWMSDGRYGNAFAASGVATTGKVAAGVRKPPCPVDKNKKPEPTTSNDPNRLMGEVAVPPEPRAMMGAPPPPPDTKAPAPEPGK